MFFRKDDMRTITLLVAITLFTSSAPAADRELPDKSGFVQMFNGKDLSGWNTTGNWVVEKGKSSP